ncbi:hypothetical protein SteCoe_37413 [Stentor coeruleus]|uniref:Alpha/beta hydrolase fold-3 domain-containing protein n=1 Tax=Stentor coeruleus TaxID=5963 RepID=A0A1R2AN61_9CILI|nr:hypothetical protein SteCoe_37413 [Stentor coeruleus]
MTEQIEDIKHSLDLILKSWTHSDKLIPLYQDLLNHKSYLEAFFISETYLQGNQKTGTTSINHIEKLLSKILEYQSQNLKAKRLKYKLKVAIARLRYVVDNIKYSFELSADDYASLDENHPRFQAVKNVTKVVEIGSKDEILRQLKIFHKRYDAVKAVIYNFLKYKQSRSRNLMTGIMLVYFAFCRSEAKRYARLYESSLNYESAETLWNMPNTTLVKKLTLSKLQSITVNQMIFIPKTSPFVLENASTDVTLEGDSGFYMKPDNDKGLVAVRILSRSSIPALPITKGEKFQNQIKKIVIHAHGGGYISMSSFSHQTYTRIWANNLDAVIFSLDYRLSPKHPFPSALDDIWQCYNWIIKFSSEHLGISPSEIVLVGDSAGGNLITSLTLKLLESGSQLPDGLLMIYPSLGKNSEYFSMSSFIALHDKILPFPLFPVMHKCFLANGNYGRDYLVSPVLAPVELLSNFPFSIMMVTESDPLCFNAFRFADKLLRANASVSINLFPHVPHGALNFGNKDAVPIFSNFIDNAQDNLKILLKLDN